MIDLAAAYAQANNRKTRPERSGRVVVSPFPADTRISLKAWSLWVLGFMAIAAVMPSDISYDVTHYHIHNGWAAWNGRLDVDFAPAGQHSFFNPVYHYFVWAMIEALPGPAVNAILAIPMALILPALYYLTRTISLVMTGQASLFVCLAVAVLGFTAEGQLELFATVRNDAWGALGFIAALAASVTPRGGLAPLYRLAIASLALGALFGMKLTNLPYAVGYAVFALVLAADWKSRLQVALVCGAAGLAGIVVVAGPHALVLWERFGNPIFPLANDVFKSPLGPDGFDTYAHRKSAGLFGFLSYPLVFTFNSHMIGSTDLDDIRFLFSYLIAPGLIGLIIWRFRKATVAPWNRLVLALCIGVLVAILVWMASMPVLRYMLAGWILGPVFGAMLFFAITGKASLKRPGRMILASFIAAMVFQTKIHMEFRVPWPSPMAPYIDTRLPDPQQFENSYVLFAGSWPTAFLAPAFPESATLAGIVKHRVFTPVLENYRDLIRSEMAANPDRPVFAVMYAIDKSADDGSIEELEELRAFLTTAGGLSMLVEDYGLVGDDSACQPIGTNFKRTYFGYYVCPVFREDALALRLRSTEPGDLG